MSALLLLHLLATGQVAPEAPAPTPAAQEQWYGWQTLVADSAATIILGVGIGLNANGVPEGDGFIQGSIWLYGLGAPILHVVHGRWWMGFLDLGIRLLATGAGAAFGAITGLVWGLAVFDPGAGLSGGVGGATVGALAGLFGACAVDAVVLARKPTPATRPVAASALRLAPFAGAVRGDPVAGLAGTF